MRKAKIFIINGVILTISSFVIRGIGLIFNIYIANKVGQEPIGVFGLVMSVYFLAITFASSGIGLACTCIVSEELEKNNISSALKVVKTCMLFSLFLSIIAAFVLFIFAPIISNSWLHHCVSNKPIYMICLALPFISVSSVISSYFASTGKSYKNAIIECIELLVKILFTISLLQSKETHNIDSICYCLVLGDVISEFASFILKFCLFYFDKRRLSYTRNYVKNMGKRIFKISFPIALTSYIKSGLSSLKQFLIPMRLQVYGLSYSLATAKYGLITGMVMPVLMFAKIFINSFSSLLIPEYARLLAGKNFNRMKTVCDRIFYITFMFSFLVTGILLFYSNEISLLVYNNLEIAPYLRFFAPIVVFMYVDNIIDNMLKGLQAQFHVMCVNICDLIITIFIIYFLVPIYGITGYLISIIFSEVFNFVSSFLLLKKKLKLNFDFWNFFAKPCFLLVITFFICSLIPSQSNSSWMYSIFKISCFAILYILFFILKQKKEFLRF